jgi:hypothetical protein
MRKLILAGAALLTLALGVPQMAAAQTAAPATSGATPEKIALVKRYFADMHINQMIGGMLHQMMPAMLAQVRKTHPEITDAQMQGLTDAVTDSMNEYMPKMIDAMIPVYADTFSTEELTKLDEFYESPVGQSILAKMPVAMQKATPVMMQLMPDMQADIVRRMCAKIDCTAKPAQ